MSVFTTVPPSLRPWSGSSKPGEPVAIWTGALEVLGDASGGSRTAIVEFKSFNAQGQPRLYNLEQLDIFDNKPTGGEADFLLNGWDRPPGGSGGASALGAVGFNIRMAASAIQGSLPDGANKFQLPKLLGIPSAFQSQTLVQFRLANSDGDILRVRFQGYVWDARSFQVDGGPVRPAGRLWD